MAGPVLLACEFGAGLGHVSRLVRHAARLRADGRRVVVALGVWAHAERLAGLADEFAAAPGWPGQQGDLAHLDATGPREAANSYASLLQQIGATSPRILPGILRAWEDQLARIRPAIVIADNAPGLLLAAQGRIPSIAIGSGFTVPAACGDVFAPVDGQPAPDRAWQISELARLAEGLRHAGRDLAQGEIVPALRGDHPSPSCLSILDPARAFRSEKLLPPEVAPPAAEAASAHPGEARYAHAIHAYFGDIRRPERQALEWLIAAAPGPIRLHAPALPADLAARCAAAGVELSPRPFTAEELASSARIVVHHGGLGICQLAAVAGVPQLILATDFERWRNAQAIAATGAGLALAAPASSAEAVARALDQLREPSAAQAAAGLRALTFGELSAPPAVDVVAGIVARHCGAA